MARKPGCPGRPPKRIMTSNLPPLGKRCPAELTGPARREWRRLASMFGSLALTAADVPTLAAYCQQVAQARVACARFTAEGAILTTPRGSVVEHPAIRQCERAQALVLKLGMALGCCPSGRKLIGALPEAVDEKEEAEMRMLFGEDKSHPRRPRRHKQEKEKENCEEDESDPDEDEDDPLSDSGSKLTKAGTSVPLCRVSAADAPGAVAGVDGNPQSVEAGTSVPLREGLKAG